MIVLFVGIIIFGALEGWLNISAWEARRFALDVMGILPRELARFLYEKTSNIDQFLHVLFFSIALVGGGITGVIWKSANAFSKK